jgi:hypothetical protein
MLLRVSTTVAAVHLGANGLKRGGERVQHAPSMETAHGAGRSTPHQPRLCSCEYWEQRASCAGCSTEQDRSHSRLDTIDGIVHTQPGRWHPAGALHMVWTCRAAKPPSALTAFTRLFRSLWRVCCGQTTCSMAGGLAVLGALVQVGTKVGSRNAINKRIACMQSSVVRQRA